ncbi:MAG: acyltransferase [Pseudomonas sp.]|uniref:acyltransferase family protein n=1 Tax=Pseudomonas sp. TaxID=306 RepID=UPI003390A545
MSQWILHPLLAVAVYALALLCASLLLRCMPAIARSLDSNGSARFASIDGLRGYLALGVFIHHAVITWFYLDSGQLAVPPSNFYAQIGVTSVALFFMITGFLFWHRLLEQGDRHDWLAFAVSRVFRLYPLYLPLLAVVLISVFWMQDWRLHESPWAVLKQVLLWLSFDRPDINAYPHTGMLIANVTWTLSYEVFFYLALPLLSLVFLKRGPWPQVLLCLAGIYLLYQLIGWNHSLKKHYLASFLGGIAAAYWVRRPALVDWGRSRLAGALALLALLVVMTAFRKSFALVPLLLLGLFFAIVASGNRLFGALQPRALRWLGEISYSTYLLHGFVLWLVVQRLPLLLPFDIRPPLPYLALLAGATCLLVLLSSLTFLYLEKPGMAAGKRLIGWLRRRQPSPTAVDENLRHP